MQAVPRVPISACPRLGVLRYQMLQMLPAQHLYYCLEVCQSCEGRCHLLASTVAAAAAAANLMNYFVFHLQTFHLCLIFRHLGPARLRNLLRNQDHLVIYLDRLLAQWHVSVNLSPVVTPRFVIDHPIYPHNLLT